MFGNAAAVIESSTGRQPRCYRQDVKHCLDCPIRPISMCAAMDDADLHRLTSVMQTQVLRSGEILFAEGETADSMFTVTSGAVRIYKLLVDGRRQITGFLKPGDFLGLAVGGVYAYTAEAITAVSICRFRRRGLEALLEDFPKLQRRLLAMASNELAIAQDQMLLLGRKTAVEKICSFLRMLADREARRGLSGDVVAVPMTRMDIGDYLGVTIETVSRTITNLKKAGVISLLDGHRIRIEDRERLAGFAEAALDA